MKLLRMYKSIKHKLSEAENGDAGNELVEMRRAFYSQLTVWFTAKYKSVSQSDLDGVQTVVNDFEEGMAVLEKDTDDVIYKDVCSTLIQSCKEKYKVDE